MVAGEQMRGRLRAVRHDVTPDRALSPIYAPSEEGLAKVCDALREAKISLSKEKKEHLRQRLAIHAHLAETMRRDQLKRARPGSHVKKFRQQATQFKQAAIFIDRFDTLHPGWPHRGSPPSPSWQIVEPEGLGMLASAAACHLGNILTLKFVTQGNRLTKFPDEEVSHYIMVNPGKMMRELLLTLAKIYATVANELAASTSRGPKKHRVVPTLLMCLAEDFHYLGGRPAKGLTGPFRMFANASFEAVGLDHNLIDSHIGKAVDHWKKILPKDSHEKTSN